MSFHFLCSSVVAFEDVFKLEAFNLYSMVWTNQLTCTATNAFFFVYFRGGEGFEFDCFVWADKDAFVAAYTC